MPSLFAITAAPDKLKTETGSATTSITVTNSTSRPLRGVVKVKPLGNTQSQWLKIDGETERDFPAGGTHQFTVTFNKPKPAPTPNPTPQPAESFPFRVDAISATNPDEDFTEGPVITVEIPEVKPAEKKGVPWWVWLIVGIVVLLLIVGVILFLVFRGGDKVEVPDVTNKTFAEANTSLQNVKLNAVKIETAANNKEPNKVFAQDPTAGTKVDVNSSVNLSVPATAAPTATPMVRVPRVIGMKFKDAALQLRENGLRMSDPIQSRDVRTPVLAGTIGLQFPLPNTSAPRGSVVQIFVPCAVVTRCGEIFDLIEGKINAEDRRLLEEYKRGTRTF
ncbi:MAG TPA: PASTA domain-containing protein [Pyrinomonadaceae bacterium]|jgi:hypothetical protein